MPEEKKSKEETKQKKKKNPQPPTLHMPPTAFLKVPSGWRRAPADSRHVSLRSSQSCPFQHPAAPPAPHGAPASHQLKLGPSCCPPHEHCSAKIRSRSQRLMDLLQQLKMACSPPASFHIHFQLNEDAT